MKIRNSLPYMSKLLLLAFLFPLTGNTLPAAKPEENLIQRAKQELGMPVVPSAPQSKSAPEPESKPVELNLVSTKLEEEIVPDYGPAGQIYVGAFPSRLNGLGKVSSREKFSYSQLQNQPGISLSGGYWFTNWGNGRLGILAQLSFSTYSFQLKALDRSSSGEMRINASSVSVGPSWEKFFNRRISIVLSAGLGQLFVSQLGKTDALSNSQSLTFVGATASPQWHLSKRWQFGPFINANREVSSSRDLQVQRIVYGIQLGHRF